MDMFFLVAFESLQIPSVWSIRVAPARERKLSAIFHFFPVCSPLLYLSFHWRQRKTPPKPLFWMEIFPPRFCVFPTRKPGKNLITQTLSEHVREDCLKGRKNIVYMCSLWHLWAEKMWKYEGSLGEVQI